VFNGFYIWMRQNWLGTKLYGALETPCIFPAMFSFILFGKFVPQLDSTSLGMWYRWEVCSHICRRMPFNHQAGNMNVKLDCWLTPLATSLTRSHVRTSGKQCQSLWFFFWFIAGRWFEEWDDPQRRMFFMSRSLRPIDMTIAGRDFRPLCVPFQIFVATI
jgi:hypothetical protein